MDKNHRRCDIILSPSLAAIRVGRPKHEATSILCPVWSVLEEEENFKGRSAPPHPGLAPGMCPLARTTTGQRLKPGPLIPGDLGSADWAFGDISDGTQLLLQIH